MATEFEIIDSTTFQEVSDVTRKTIVGNSKASTFEPLIEIVPWEDNDVLKFWKDTDASTQISSDLSNKGGLIWQDSKELITFNPLQVTKEPQFDDCTWSGAKFTILLNEKPKIDPDGFARFTWKMSGYEDMDFLPQPAKGEEGYELFGTPIWIEHSIAVYHKTKRNNHPGRTYKTGKVCHLCRPWCRDSLGNFTWGKLEYDLVAGTITKVIPAGAFNFVGATWWLVDETFGTTAQGGSTGGWLCDGAITGSREGFNPASDGTADSCSAWVLGTGGMTSRNVAMCLYDNSDNSFITDGNTNEVSVSAGADQEITFTYTSKPSVLSAAAYNIVVWGELAAGDVEIYGDFISSAGGQEVNGNMFTWPDPWVPTNANRRFSLYCTYTPAVGGNAPTGALYGPLVGPLGGPI